ncbi:glycosyltransferase family 9 protein [Thiohalobacter sp. IOR34]|uniref:glycosyltransferase family 9 protein n=1 Tax=Thiohalobacter sp. IOR34 TaxID=3057176 RepID=UPI0025B1BE15|nr:glycosyltransferase family 9 protein [Thiohalobacter sp. IOR34]WJW75272.1 glycosyltransferase family 9 protein [Thiohalobacter sp. IOR34]
MSELVIQPLPGIGDMVWHLPVLHALAGQTEAGRVDVLTKPRSRADQLLGADPCIGRVLWLERGAGRHGGLRGLLRLASELRAAGYRRVWILHNSPRYVLAAWLAGIPERIGYGRSALHRALLTRPVLLSPSEAAGHPIDKAGILLDRLGIACDPEPRLAIDPAASAAVEARFAHCPRPWLAIGIGSSEPFKQWGEARFVALGKALGARAGSLMLVGGPAEAALGEAIRRGLSGAGVPVELALDLSIRDTAALLAACRLYVGNDTGFLNMAAAAGVEAVGVFGGSPPLSHSVRIHCVLPEDGSRPWYGAPYIDRISVEAVLAEVDRQLQKG